LTSLDSSIIDLSVTLFDWAKFRRTKGAIKLHLLLDHDGYLPDFALITEGKRSDVKVAHQLEFDPGTIVVYDRGYNDYRLFGQWTAQGVFFVTRMKDNALYEVVGERDVPQNRHILKDQLIQLTGLKAEEKCPYPLRRVEVYVPETDEILVFLTNNMDFGATTIAAIYKDRWQIEIFFKALKQNLKMKTFVGTSANAVKI
jgi:IS4 transposase